MTGGWLHGSAEFPTLLFLPFSLSPGPAERVRRRVCSLEAEKERNLLHFFCFFLFFLLGFCPSYKQMLPVICSSGAVEVLQSLICADC